MYKINSCDFAWKVAFLPNWSSLSVSWCSDMMKTLSLLSTHFSQPWSPQSGIIQDISKIKKIFLYWSHRKFKKSLLSQLSLKTPEYNLLELKKTKTYIKYQIHGHKTTNADLKCRNFILKKSDINLSANILPFTSLNRLMT